MPDDRAARSGRTIRSPRDLLAGIALLAVAALALRSTAALDAGTLRALGPAMLPRAVAIAVGGIGAALAALSLLRAGPPLGRWPLRGPLFVTLAVVAFALTIRTAGLAVAGPLVVVVSGFASPDHRKRELVLFALVMTAVCIGLFRYALSLPIPVLVVPGVVTI